MGTLITILLFLLVLGVLVLVHEFGHFTFAKKSGVKVDEFGFGFPPRLWSRKIKETVYSLNWLPLGGFVKIKGVAGDDPHIENLAAADSFSVQPFYKKISILGAGIFMNVVLAVILFSVTFFLGVQMEKLAIPPGAIVTKETIMITAVFADTSAAQVGVLPGDEIITYNDQKLTSIDEFQHYTKQHVNQDIALKLQRQKQQLEVIATVKEISANGETYVGIGVGLQEVATVRYGIWSSLYLGVQTVSSIIGQIFLALGGIIVKIFQAQNVGQDFTGPLGIAVLTKEVAQLGVTQLLQFTAVLSVNLAVFNFLPIPALDGGRIIFVILEKIRRKPVSHKLEAIIHNIGFILLILLILLVTARDIRQFF